jgi:hypothetical protein
MWHITINGMVYFGDHGASTLIATYIQALVFDARLLLSTLSFIFLFHQLEKVFTYKQVEQQA